MEQPGAADLRDIDRKLLDRVRGLLAKAESTTFEAEAEALTAKAQELMARHSIDHAMLAGPRADEQASSLDLTVANPYASPKASLLGVIARANRCEAVWTPHLHRATVFGFGVDLEMVELLYTSLLVQATAAMVAAGSQVDQYGRSRTRSFRSSFLLSYATRIGERLRQATAAAAREAEATHGAALVPVLAAREEHVKEAVAKAFPVTRAQRPSVSNGSGWRAGRVAADQAHLGVGTSLPGDR
jgi:hypothetical protein